ncbi:cation efflux system protein CusF (plasmid) [Klebsiella pneumoniae]|nr:cation efflux system protein CusF [Klebsiella pneumoniae]
MPENPASYRVVRTKSYLFNKAAETHQHGDMNAASDASVQQVIRGSGVVKAIDMNSKKITISHEAIPAVGWPAMTMRFTFVNADDAIDAINALKTGNHVDFSFIQQGNISLLKSINVTQS